MDDGSCWKPRHQKQHHQSAQIEHGILPSNPRPISIGIRRVAYCERHAALSTEPTRSERITEAAEIPGRRVAKRLSTPNVNERSLTYRRQPNS